MVGIDVYHDSKSKAVGKVSVAGVVCSLNATYSKWHSSIAEQIPGQELIDTLKVRLLEGCKGIPPKLVTMFPKQFDSCFSLFQCEQHDAYYCNHFP